MRKAQELDPLSLIINASKIESAVDKDRWFKTP
jgi:hypothetical protein